jgi:subtilisin family serine protease
MAMSNFGSSIGRRGLMAPGDAITSLDAAGGSATSGGTSVAVPFVTGAIALLWSMFPQASGTAVRSAVTTTWRRRCSVVPPILDGAAAYQRLAAAQPGR